MNKKIKQEIQNLKHAFLRCNLFFLTDMTFFSFFFSSFANNQRLTINFSIRSLDKLLDLTFFRITSVLVNSCQFFIKLIHNYDKTFSLFLTNIINSTIYASLILIVMIEVF